MTPISTSAKRRASRLAKPEERAQYVARPIRREVEIAFPVPPSTAKLLYGPAERRMRTRVYRAWLNMAAMKARLGETRPGRIAGLCDAANFMPEGRPLSDGLTAACLTVAAEVGAIASTDPEYVRTPTILRTADAANVRMVFTAIPVDPLDEAEILARTREGQTVPHIAAMVGVTEGQVRTVQSAALTQVHDILARARDNQSPEVIAIAYGMPVEHVRAIIVRGRP